jgi:hypothetical protein
MKLLLIEPQDGNLNLLTYRCGGARRMRVF